MENSLGSLEDVIPDFVVIEVCFNELNLVLGVWGKIVEEFIFLFVAKGADSSFDLVSIFEEELRDMLSRIATNTSHDYWDIFVEIFSRHVG